MTDIKPMDEIGYHEVQIEQFTKQAEIALSEYHDLLSHIEWHKRQLQRLTDNQEQPHD